MSTRGYSPGTEQHRILQNQIEIMWALNILIGKLLPDLVGRGGELDRMRDDLADAAKSTRQLLEGPRP